MKKSILRSSFRALGTQVDIRIVFENEKQAKETQVDVQKVRNIFSTRQKIFCRFNPASELSKLNENPGVWQKASLDMLYLAGRALFYNRESDGLYDPRVIEVLEKIGYRSDKLGVAKSAPKPGKLENLPADLKIRQNKIFFGHRMDFSGIAKGYIIDKATEFLKKRGWKNFFINVNGDAYAAGFDAKGKKWKLPIEGARDKKAFLSLSNGAAATSGVIKRQWKHGGKNVHHLINPKNPNRFSFEIKSVVVVHKKAEWADGRAKVLVLTGFKKGFRYAKKKKLKALFVDSRGKVTPTFNVPECISVI